MSAYHDPLDDAGLFDMEMPPPVSLADKFGVPPMSVLDRRSGEWQDRRRRWGMLGIQSEIGRSDDLTYGGMSTLLSDPLLAKKYAAGVPATSIFDPVLCELVYRWFTSAGDRALDPFAGGSVRGIVASALARHYTGIDLRAEQVEANRAQTHLGSDIAPKWIVGDSGDMGAALHHLDEDYDLVFSCPPYADLEVYSDNPRDLSRMGYDQFRATHARVIREATRRLRHDRFASWVISDVRDKKGAYRGLVMDTIKAFTEAGLSYHNDCVLVDPIGTGAVRAERPFRATRKVARSHQHLLIFVKGDAKRAAARLEEIA